MHRLFRIILGLLFNILFLNQSFAQDINQALAEAYSSHPLLFAERASGRAVAENVTDALSGWRPEVSLSSSIGKKIVTTTASGKSADTDNNSPVSVGMSIEQTIYDSGQRQEVLNIAESEVLLSQAKLMKVETDVLLDASKAYLNFVKEQSLLKIAKKNVEVVERQLQATKDRFDVGDVTITDVSQAEARLSDAIASLVRSESNLESAKVVYMTTIGKEPLQVSYPNVLPLMPANIEELSDKALSQNPNVVISSYIIETTKSKLNLALKELGPTVSLRASVNQSWDPNTFFEEQRYLDLNAVLSWPLYRGGKEWSNIRRLKEKVRQHTLEKDNFVRLSSEESIKLWNTIERARAEIKAYKSSIYANEVALNGVKEEENVGSRTVIDVLDAENELFRARANLIIAERDFYVYVYALLASIGDLNARSLSLPVDSFYNPEEYYNKVRNASWGRLENN